MGILKEKLNCWFHGFVNCALCLSTLIRGEFQGLCMCVILIMPFGMLIRAAIRLALN